MPGRITKIRNRCRSQLDIDKWYRRKYVAEVLGDDSLGIAEIKKLLEPVAYFEIDGKNLIRILEIKEPKRYKPLTERERAIKRLKREEKEKDHKPPRVQYAKCVRVLIENYYKENHVDLTYKSLIHLYLRNPLEYFFLPQADLYNDILSKTIRCQVGWDMYNIAHTKNEAIKKYLLRNTETQKSCQASVNEAAMIDKIFGEHGMQFTNNLSMLEFNKAKQEINKILRDKVFICTAFEVNYYTSFPHRELYVPELIRSKILRKWDAAISREITDIENTKTRKICYELFQKWRIKHITPYLISDDILKEVQK